MMMDRLNEHIVFLAGTYVFPPGPPSELSGNSLMCICMLFLNETIAFTTYLALYSFQDRKNTVAAIVVVHIDLISQISNLEVVIMNDS